MSARPVVETLRHLWSSLSPLKLPMTVMGGIALSAWKHVRMTHDVDLLLDILTSDVNVVLHKLGEAGFRPKRQPPVLSLAEARIVQLLYEPLDAYLELQVDLLLADTPYQLVALSRRQPARLPGLDIEVQVLSCEDLVLHKLLTGRVIDRADAAALLRANQAALDLSYLMHWTRTLVLGAELAEVWEEAFPGEKPPV